MTLLNTLLGHFAMWSVRQSPYLCPDELAVAIAEFAESVKRHPQHFVAMGSSFVGDAEATGSMSQMDLEALVMDCFGQSETIKAWNSPKSGHDSAFVAVSRFGGPAADDDFIDLHALARNIACSVLVEEASEQ